MGLVFVMCKFWHHFSKCSSAVGARRALATVDSNFLYISLSSSSSRSQRMRPLSRLIYYFGRSDNHGESQTVSAAQNQTAGISMQIFVHEQRARTKFHAWLIAMEIRQLWKKYGFLLRGRRAHPEIM